MPDKRSNEQIDKINENRKLLGEPEMVPYETDDNNGDGAGETEEQKIARLEQEKITADAAAETERLRLEEESKAKNTDTKVEIDDEAVLAYLEKKSGKKVSSLDEYLNPKKEATAEDKEKESQLRESNKIAYALQNGKFSDKELKAFHTDSKNPHDLVLAQYIAEQKAADPELTDTEIEAEFKEKFGLDQEEASRKFKRGQTELNLLADNLLRQKHGKIINFDNEYNSIEQEQLTNKQVQQKILSEAPKYKKDVEDVYNELGKVKIKFGTKEYEIEVPKDIIEAQKVNALDEKYAADRIKEGWTKDNIKETALKVLKANNFEALSFLAAEAYSLDKAKGTHGIPPKGDQDKKDKQQTLREENLKKYHGEAIPATN